MYFLKVYHFCQQNISEGSVICYKLLPVFFSVLLHMNYCFVFFLSFLFFKIPVRTVLKLCARKPLLISLSSNKHLIKHLHKANCTIKYTMFTSTIITILKQSETYIRNPYSTPVCQPTALHEEDSRKHSVYGLTKLQTVLSFPLRHCPFLFTLQPQKKRIGRKIIQPSNVVKSALATDEIVCVCVSFK